MARIRIVLAAATAAACVATVQAGSAAASPPITPGSTAFSTPSYTGTGTVRATLALTGSLGGLLDGLIGPIVNQDLNPLVDALKALSFNSLVSAALGVSSSYTAGTPSFETTPAPGAFPAETVPPAGCGDAAGLPCYDASSNLAPALGSLASIALSRVSGYTQQLQNSADVHQTMFGRSRVAGPSVSVLPGIAGLANPLASSSTVDSKALCPNDGTDPDATSNVSSVTLLGGLVRFSVVDGDVATLTVNGVSYTGVATLPTVTVGAVTISPYGGTAVRVAVAISAAQILGAIGLPASITSVLLGDVPTASLSLNVIVGPRSALTTTSSMSTGLGIAVDLSGSIGFTLLGLVGASVTIPSGATGGNFGNILDLRLAYATCTVGAYPGSPGSGSSAKAIPPALV